ALKELNECIVDGSDVDLSCALPLWAKNYTKCCLVRIPFCVNFLPVTNVFKDSDSKVREEANNVMKTFSEKLKRQLASQIKLIMPYLLICEHDAYSGVVSAAKSVLDAMFSSTDKRILALIFCKEIILNECADLCLNTEKFLKTDAQEAPTDDYSKETKELCIQRLIVCSLKVLTSLVKSLDDENLESLDLSFRKSIFEQPKFWSIMKHKNGQ
uniref:E3 ubiquitin-protein ligase listerin n=1 Tax=Romanomermis culicivorax TaxID=13658 RepID=A0A915KXQ4_ROMCU